MMASLGHVACELRATARVRLEQSPLALSVEVSGEESARTPVVHPQDDAVAVCILAVAAEVMQHSPLRFHRTQNPERCLPILGLEAGYVFRSVAHTFYRAIFGQHAPEKLRPLALKPLSLTLAQSLPKARLSFEQPREETVLLRTDTALAVVLPPGDACVVECADFDIGGVQLVLRVLVEEVPQAAVVVGIAWELIIASRVILESS